MIKMENPYIEIIEKLEKNLKEYESQLKDYGQLYVYNLVKNADKLLKYADKSKYGLYETLPVPEECTNYYEYPDSYYYGLYDRYWNEKDKKSVKRLIKTIVERMDNLRFEIGLIKKKLGIFKKYSEDFENISKINNDEAINKYMSLIDKGWERRKEIKDYMDVSFYVPEDGC